MGSGGGGGGGMMGGGGGASADDLWAAGDQANRGAQNAQLEAYYQDRRKKREQMYQNGGQIYDPNGNGFNFADPNSQTVQPGGGVMAPQGQGQSAPQQGGGGPGVWHPQSSWYQW